MLLSDKCFQFSYAKFRHSNHRIGAHTCTNHTVPYGTALWGGAVPGTSCQATIAPSLRDISQQAPTKWLTPIGSRRTKARDSSRPSNSRIALLKRLPAAVSFKNVIHIRIPKFVATPGQTWKRPMLSKGSHQPPRVASKQTDLSTSNTRSKDSGQLLNGG